MMAARRHGRRTIGGNMRRIATFAAVLALALSGAARAEELTILSAVAMRAGLDPIIAGYHEAHVDAQYGTSVAIQRRLAAGERADLVILPRQRLESLLAAGQVSGAITPLASVRLGLAVAAGAARPPIATLEQFEAALRAAPSIALASPDQGATTGVYFATLFKRLGIAQELAPKLTLAADGSAAAEAVAHGQASLMAGLISEIMEVGDVDLVGPLPTAVQLVTLYAGAPVAHGHDPAAAAQLLRYLADPGRAMMLMRHGLEAPTQGVPG
jgi:molybdate transport system substrate-binding protein